MVDFENRSAAYMNVREHRESKTAAAEGEANRRKPPFAGPHQLKINRV